MEYRWLAKQGGLLSKVVYYVRKQVQQTSEPYEKEKASASTHLRETEREKINVSEIVEAVCGAVSS